MSDFIATLARALLRGRSETLFAECVETAEIAAKHFRAVLLEEIAAIRAQGHITDTDAEQGMREMRALAVWRVVERIEGNSHD